MIEPQGTSRFGRTLREGQGGAPRDHARGEICAARHHFDIDYGAKSPKAVASLRRDETDLPSLFDFPTEHWVHLRTANVIEAAFATRLLRQRVTKGAGSGEKGLLMAFKLFLMAQERWRRINGALGRL